MNSVNKKSDLVHVFLQKAIANEDLDSVSQAAFNCLKKDQCNLQDLESILRKNECSWYFIARSEDRKIPKLPNGEVKTYNLFLSRCSNDIFKESKSYEENFDKLARTGFLLFTNESDYQNFLKKSNVVEFNI